MEINGKLDELTKVYNDFLSKNPSGFGRHPKRMHKILSQLKASGVSKEKVAEACEVSTATAARWLRSKKLEGGSLNTNRPAGFVVRRPKETSELIPILQSAGGNGQAAPATEKPVFRKPAEITLLINGAAVTGSIEEIRKLLGFEAE